MPQCCLESEMRHERYFLDAQLIKIPFFFEMIGVLMSLEVDGVSESLEDSKIYLLLFFLIT